MHGELAQPLDNTEVVEKQWYVINAYSGLEKKVAKALEERIEYSKHKEHFGTVLVPTEEVVEMRAGKKRRSERRFFPGYLFVEMHMNEDTWQLVNSIPRVKGFVGGTIQKPAPLPPHEVESILERIRQGSDKVTPKTVFEPGELVRIIDGPFNDFNGTVEEVSYEKHRLVVAVTIFGRFYTG